MKLNLAIIALLCASAQAKGLRRQTKGNKASKQPKMVKATKAPKGVVDVDPVEPVEPEPTGSPTTKCPEGYSSKHKGPFPLDNSERLLLREGVISEIPASLCTNSANGKNVILVVGDGMVSTE